MQKRPSPNTSLNLSSKSLFLPLQIEQSSTTLILSIKLLRSCTYTYIFSKLNCLDKFLIISSVTLITLLTIFFIHNSSHNLIFPLQILKTYTRLVKKPTKRTFNKVFVKGPDLKPFSSIYFNFQKYFYLFIYTNAFFLRISIKILTLYILWIYPFFVKSFYTSSYIDYYYNKPNIKSNLK